MLYFIFLYALLSHPNFQVRESASLHLVRLVDRYPDVYGPRLAELAAGATDPEASARVRRVAVCWRRHVVNAYIPKTAPVWPISDAGTRPFFFGVDLRDKNTLFPWFQQAGQRPGDHGSPFWTRYRRATELWAREMIGNGATYEEMDQAIGRMWTIERRHQSDSADASQAEIESWKGWIGIPFPRNLQK